MKTMRKNTEKHVKSKEMNTLIKTGRSKRMADTNRNTSDRIIHETFLELFLP